ncbi:MAG TPA: Gmad2 immunoglobulin-like domain-containing protein [Thermoanaerobaculia bacterium]
MRRVAIVILLLAGCSNGGDQSATTPGSGSPGRPPATTTATPPAERPPAVVRNIEIETVEVGNPLVITGRARTFENNVSLRVRDAEGVLIAEGFTTATGEMGTHSPFRGTLWLTREPGDRIVVEALEYSAKDGSEQSLVTVERPFDVEPVEAQLWFADKNCTAASTFKRRMPKSVSMARLLVEALIAGPTAPERQAGAVGSFPQGSAVRSVNLRDGVLTVDFNERLRNVGGSCRALMIRESVTQTLRALPSVSRVVITADGSEPLALQP